MELTGVISLGAIGATLVAMWTATASIYKTDRSKIQSDDAGIAMMKLSAMFTFLGFIIVYLIAKNCA